MKSTYYILLLTAITMLAMIAVSASCMPGDQERLVFQDDFSDPGSGWKVANVPAEYSAAYINGEYVIKLMKKVSTRGIPVPAGAMDNNYVVEVDMRCMDQKIDISSAGLNFGLHTIGFYRFYVCSSKGVFFIDRMIDDKFQTLVDVTPSPAICKNNETNKLRLKVQGNTVTAYVNGTELTTIEIPSLPRGPMGLGLESASFVPISYAFDNFKLYDLSARTATPASSSSSNLLQSKKKVLLYEDDFSKCKGMWKTLDDLGSVDCGNGVLRLSTGNQQAGMKAGNVAEWDVADFVVEFDIKRVAGGVGSQFSLAFRATGKTENILMVFGNRFGVEGAGKKLEPGKDSNLIKQGNATNRYRIICVGNKIEIYVNDNLLGAYTDTSADSGLMFFIVNSDGKSETAYSIDNFKLYELQ